MIVTSPRPPSSTSPSSSSSNNATLLWCLTSCFLYGFGSGGMSFFNKALVQTLGFHYSNALLWMQCILCVGSVMGGRIVGVVASGKNQSTIPAAATGSITSNILSLLPSSTSPHFKQSLLFYLRLLPLSLFYLLNTGCGMLSLQGLSLPMYSVLKRFTPIIVVMIEYLMYAKTTTRRVYLSLFLVTSGLILAGLGDLRLDLTAYTLALISCTSQALYLIHVDTIGRELGLSSSELLYYNSSISLWFLTPYILYTGELSSCLFTYPDWSSPIFLFCLLMMLLMGNSLSYCQFLCTQVNSPLTTCMVGVIKGIVTTIFGFFMFGGQPVTFLNLLGVTLNTIGGALYAYAKYEEKQSSQSGGASGVKNVELNRLKLSHSEMEHLMKKNGSGSVSPIATSP